MSIWVSEANGKIRCQLCPRNCLIADGEVGFCKVRANRGGELELLVMRRPCAVAIDPIEKKPLYHFYPGSSILSVGTIGCNLNCDFCQNWHISRADSIDSPEYDSAQLVRLAGEKKCIGIAYTYNEPIVYGEYVQELAERVAAVQLKNVVVTAGYINKKAHPFFFKNIDAVNVDLKAFDPLFYGKFCGGELDVVLDTLLYIKEETNIWLELTNLIIPKSNDDGEMIKKMCDWIVQNLGAEVPLHFSAFYPNYKLNDRDITSSESLKKAQETAYGRGLKHVYLGNVGAPYELRCGNCHSLCDLTGICGQCKNKIAGHFHGPI